MQIDISLKYLRLKWHVITVLDPPSKSTRVGKPCDDASISIQKYQCDPKRDCAENQGTWAFMSPQRLGSATSCKTTHSRLTPSKQAPQYIANCRARFGWLPTPGGKKCSNKMIWKETLQITNQWSYCLTRSKQSPAAPTLWIKPWEWSSATALVAMSLFHRGKAVSDPLGNVQQWLSLAEYIQLPYVHRVK